MFWDEVSGAMKSNMMFGNTLKRLVWVLKYLSFEEILKLIFMHTLSINHFYILYANLKSVMFIKNSRVSYCLRKIGEKEIDEVIGQIKTYSAKDRKEIMTRFLFYLSGFRNCYVARHKNGEIMFMQWIIYPEENHIIAKLYANRFKLLKDNQVLIENAFTFPKYRGLGLFAAVTSDLLKKAKEEGYKGAVTYIRKDALDSLNEFIKQGFKLHEIIKEYKILGMTKRMFKSR